MNDLKHFLAVAEQAARVGGRVLQDWRGRFSVREKGPADLVTDADEASQEAVRKTILAAFPDHDVLAEEDLRSKSASRISAGLSIPWTERPITFTVCRITPCRLRWNTTAGYSRRPSMTQRR